MKALLSLYIICFAFCGYSYAQKITVLSAGTLTLQTKSTDPSSPSIDKTTAVLNYYYEADTLSYYLEIRDGIYVYGRLKAGSKRYNFFMKNKTYESRDSVLDIIQIGFYVKYFIDREVISGLMAREDVSQKDTAIGHSKYIKYYFHEKQDTVIFGGVKQLMKYSETFAWLVNPEKHHIYKTMTTWYGGLEGYDEVTVLRREEKPLTQVKQLIADRKKDIETHFKPEDNLIIPPLNITSSPAEIRSLDFKNVQEGTIHFKDIQEDFILLDFWYPSCLPCLQSIPELNKLQAEFPTLKIIGANVVQMPPALMDDFIKRKNIIYTIALDPEKKIANLFNIKAFPTWLLFHKDGRLIATSETSTGNVYDEVSKYLRSNK